MGFAGAFHPPPDRSLIVGNTGVPSVGMDRVGGLSDPVAEQKKGVQIQLHPHQTNL